MSGNCRSIISRLAGTLGVAGASLIALPSLASSLNPNPTILSEAPYNRIAQTMPAPDMMTPGSTEGTPRSSSPSLAKVNPNPSIFNEAPYNRLSQSTGVTTSPSGGMMQMPSGEMMPSGSMMQTPSGTSGASTTDRLRTPGGENVTAPSNPTTDQTGTSGDSQMNRDMMMRDRTTPSSGSSAPVAEPSNVGPTLQQSPNSVPTSPNTRTDETTTPVTPNGSSGDVTVPTSPSTTTPDSTTTSPSNSTTTPDNSTTTPSESPTGGQSGNVRALW